MQLLVCYKILSYIREANDSNDEIYSSVISDYGEILTLKPSAGKPKGRSPGRMLYEADIFY